MQQEAGCKDKKFKYRDNVAILYSILSGLSKGGVRSVHHCCRMAYIQHPKGNQIISYMIDRKLINKKGCIEITPKGKKVLDYLKEMKVLIGNELMFEDPLYNPTVKNTIFAYEQINKS